MHIIKFHIFLATEHSANKICSKMGVKYSEIIKFLGSLYSYERDAQRQSPPEFHLEKITEVLERLGNPQLSYPVVHITGTKGKGSVAFMLTSIAMAAGLNVGTYTSPHVINIRERIAINGKPLSKRKFAYGIDQVRAVLGERPKEFGTFFEVMTAAALNVFADEEVDLAIIEAGLGARFDATNVVMPNIAIITRIGLDHTERLGNTIEEIAQDKSHIIKRGCDVVVEKQADSVLSIIKERAKSSNARLFVSGLDFHANILEKSLGRTKIEISSDSMHFWTDLPLVGGFQAENAGAAAMAAHLLGIQQDAIAKGLKDVSIIGRMQIISLKPLIILDGAHNPTSAETIAYEVISFGLAPAIFVVAINEPKDFSNMLLPWSKVAKLFIFTTTGSPRSYDPRMLAKEAEHRFGISCIVEENPINALMRAQKIAGESGNIIVTGSLYLVGEILRNFNKF